MAIPFGEKQKPEPAALSQKLLVAMIKNKFADERTGKNTQYEISDAALSAFAVFFLQNPSFLAQQITLQKTRVKIICKPCLALTAILRIIRFVAYWMRIR